MNGGELDAFINDILDKKSLPGVTPEVRAQLVADMRERLLDQINRALINALPSEKVTELGGLLDKGADEASLQKFIMDAGVDTRRVTIETMLKFRMLYLGTEKSS